MTLRFGAVGTPYVLKDLRSAESLEIGDLVLVQIRGGDVRRGATIVKDNEERVKEDLQDIVAEMFSNVIRDHI